MSFYSSPVQRRQSIIAGQSSPIHRLRSIIAGTYPPLDTPRHNGNPNSIHSQNISLTSENFTFPPEKSLSGPSPAKFGSGGRGREPSACSEIVRFSTSASGEIGRIPNEWSRCLLPLVRDKKVQIQGFCKSAPHNLGLMDTINLSISVYINSSILHTSHQTSVKAEFTPTDLYTRNQRLDIKDSSGVPPPLLNAPKLKNSSSNGSTVEPEETISDNDLDNIVGVANVSELEEMELPNTLLCELRLYEKQALHFMVNLEKGPCVDDAATTLHPCWDAYHLADKRKFIVYVNSFSGEATVEFPSTLQMARGGVYSMGLGKTIMTISLLAHTEKGGSLDKDSTSEINGSDQSSSSPKKAAKFSGFDKLRKHKQSLIGAIQNQGLCQFMFTMGKVVQKMPKY
ncbi:hypothetical protein Lser_V15G03616 [Lactuca serriola]